mgnify:CR=1 FL=1|jgi:hypothetical protein
MVDKMQTKSARLLAFLLALIMIGSVLAYAFRGGTSSSREIKADLGEGTELLRYANGDEIIYFNFTPNSSLMILANAYMKNVFKDQIFRHFSLSSGASIREMVVSYNYTDGNYLYMINIGGKKAYFSYTDKETYNGFEVRVNGPYAAVLQTSPILLGTYPAVLDAVDIYNDKKTGDLSTTNYTSQIGQAEFMLVFKGDVLDNIMSGNVSADFYAIAYRMNGSYYEKVVVMHFTEPNVFFVRSNQTAYNYVKNVDGLSISIMGDYNLTRLMDAQPEMRKVTIQMEQ